jgi:hypothetical protein
MWKIDVKTVVTKTKGPVCHGSFVFTVQLRLTRPGLPHGEKIEKLGMRNKLHQENHPDAK